MRSHCITRAICLLLIVLLFSPGLMAQDSGTPEDERPVPYEPEEFPQWARDLRRGEIIALGSFPVAMILTNLGYRLGKFGVESIQRGEFATEYAPAFTSPEQRATLSDQQQLGVIITAGAISLAVATIDYLLGRRERREGSSRD